MTVSSHWSFEVATAGYGIVLDECIPIDAEEAMKRLAARNIGTRPFFWPMHLQPVFNKSGLFAGESYPVAEKLASRGFYVPSGLALGKEQIMYVARSVKEMIDDCLQ